MGSSTTRIPPGHDSPLPWCPAETRGPLGIHDHGDPLAISYVGDTPGVTGRNDGAVPPRFLRLPESEQICSEDFDTGSEVSGSVPISFGSAGVVSVVRIPVPGTQNLFVELSPRGHVPKSGSTSTIFIQDPAGKRLLRLDYGWNKTTGTVDYHWNQKGTHAKFGITDHTTTGKGGRPLYHSAKYLRYGGRILLVVGVAADVYSIVEAKKRWRQVTRVVAGWGGAWAGCKILGAGGAAVGTAIEPGGGTAVVGLVGCVVGGIGGYAGASWAAGEIYDYVEETFFEELPETGVPAGAPGLDQVFPAQAE